MANQAFNPIHTEGKNRVIICGSFAPNGTSAPDLAKGKGWSVVRTSQGLFTITLEDTFYQFESIDAELQLASAATTRCQVAASSPSAKTVAIRTQAGASVADPATNANNRVNFIIIARNSDQEY